MDSYSLIHTKFNPPRSVSDLIERSLLTEKLNQRPDRKLTLVAAPAGYGKSTLVAEWLKTCELPGVWLLLDESDSDLRHCPGPG